MVEKTKKKSFIFNVEWQEILLDYPSEVRLEVYDAIIEYVASGTLTELKPMAKMAFSFIKKEIDFNNDRYNDIITKRSQAGKKGMAIRYNDGLTKLTNDNKTSKCYQTVTNVTDNDNDNDNDNDYIPPYNIPPLRDDEEETPPPTPVTTGQIPLEEFRRRIAENPVTNPTNEELRRGLGLGGDTETLEKWLDEYIAAQTASGNTANYFAEYRRHFANWARIKKKNTPGNGTEEETRPRYYKPL